MVGLFRAVPIVLEINGRAAEVYVGVSSDVTKARPYLDWRAQNRRRRLKSQGAIKPNLILGW